MRAGLHTYVEIFSPDQKLLAVNSDIAGETEYGPDGSVSHSSQCWGAQASGHAAKWY